MGLKIVIDLKEIKMYYRKNTLIINHKKARNWVRNK